MATRILHEIEILEQLWKGAIQESFLWSIIQLLTNEALDMMWYRPENTNIGILWSISHHIQCLISQ